MAHKALLTVIKYHSTSPLKSHECILGTWQPVCKWPAILWSSFAIFSASFPRKSVGKLTRKGCKQRRQRRTEILRPAGTELKSSCAWRRGEIFQQAAEMELKSWRLWILKIVAASQRLPSLHGRELTIFGGLQEPLKPKEMAAGRISAPCRSEIL